MKVKMVSPYQEVPVKGWKADVFKAQYSDEMVSFYLFSYKSHLPFALNLTTTGKKKIRESFTRFTGIKHTQFLHLVVEINEV